MELLRMVSPRKEVLSREGNDEEFDSPNPNNPQFGLEGNKILTTTADR